MLVYSQIFKGSDLFRIERTEDLSSVRTVTQRKQFVNFVKLQIIIILYNEYLLYYNIVFVSLLVLQQTKINQQYVYVIHRKNIFEGIG